MKFCLISCGAWLLLLAGCGHATNASTNPPSAELKSWPDSGGKFLPLASGCSVRIAELPPGSGTDATIKDGRAEAHLWIGRGASFYGFREFPGTVVVLDAYASGDNRFLIFVLDKNNAKSELTEIAHEDAEAGEPLYSHTYYDMVKATKTGVSGYERQYGNTPPSRRRLFKIAFAHPSTISFGPWQSDR